MQLGFLLFSTKLCHVEINTMLDFCFLVFALLVEPYFPPIMISQMKINRVGGNHVFLGQVCFLKFIAEFGLFRVLHDFCNSSQKWLYVVKKMHSINHVTQHDLADFDGNPFRSAQAHLHQHRSSKHVVIPSSFA